MVDICAKSGEEKEQYTYLYFNYKNYSFEHKFLPLGGESIILGQYFETKKKIL